MATVVDLSVSVDAIPLGRALPPDGSAELELERVVPSAIHACPYVWLVDRTTDKTRDRIDAFERRARSEEAIERVARVGTVEGAVLYRVEWSEGAPAFVRAVTVHDGAILEATGSAAGWHVRLRFEDGSGVAAFQRACDECAFSLEFSRVTDLEKAPGFPADVTGAQLDALLAAHRRGYFEWPRETSLEEVADVLDVSPQAAGGRIRRGVANLIDSTLPVAEPDEREPERRGSSGG